MEYNAKTKLADILAAYPWLPDEMIKMDSRFSVIKSPIGKMLIRNATIEDASKRVGYPVDVIIDELKKLIAAHEAK